MKTAFYSLWLAEQLSFEQEQEYCYFQFPNSVSFTPWQKLKDRHLGSKILVDLVPRKFSFHEGDFNHFFQTFKIAPLGIYRTLGVVDYYQIWSA